MLVFRCVLLLVLGVSANAQGSPQSNFCQAPPVTAPPQVFGFRSSLLQLFPSFKVGCNGYLRKWAIISQTATGFGLYLTVWRQAASNDRGFKIIGSTQVPAYQVTANAWFEYIVPQPFPVEANDIVGLHYGDWTEPWSHNGFIPVTNVDQQVPQAAAKFNGPTLVIQKDNNDVIAETAGNGGYLDMTRAATVSQRLPAVIAYVDTSYATLPPTTLTPPPAYYEAEYVNSRPPTAYVAIFPEPTTPLPASGRSSSKCFAPIRLSRDCNFTLNSYTTKFFFNIPIRQCSKFWYYKQCVDTLNVFETRQQCERECAVYLDRVQ